MNKQEYGQKNTTVRNRKPVLIAALAAVLIACAVLAVLAVRSCSDAVQEPAATDTTFTHTFTKPTPLTENESAEPTNPFADETAPLSLWTADASSAAYRKALCKTYGWTAVSMKRDWTTIYGDGVTKT